jgi:hypothetical protein
MSWTRKPLAHHPSLVTRHPTEGAKRSQPQREREAKCEAKFECLNDIEGTNDVCTC